MLKKILKELTLIRKELQAISSNLQFSKEENPKMDKIEIFNRSSTNRERQLLNNAILSKKDLNSFYTKDHRRKILNKIKAPENQLRPLTEETGLRILDGIYILIEMLRKDELNGAEQEII